MHNVHIFSAIKVSSLSLWIVKDRKIWIHHDQHFRETFDFDCRCKLHHLKQSFELWLQDVWFIANKSHIVLFTELFEYLHEVEYLL